MEAHTVLCEVGTEYLCKIRINLWLIFCLYTHLSYIFSYFSLILSVLYHFCPSVCTVRTIYTHDRREVCALLLTRILAYFINHLSYYNLVYKQYLFRFALCRKSV